MVLKKFIFSFLCLVLLSSCCGVQEEATREEPTKTVYKTKEAETFVNPIFYKTMYPISKMTWKTNLTPTEMVEENDENFVIKSYCTMLENKEDEITLKCTTIHPPSLSVYTLFYRFIIEDRNSEYFPNRVYIKRLFFSVEEYLKDKDDYTGLEHFHTKN